MRKKILLSLFLITTFFCFAQNKTEPANTDLKTAKQDTNYVISLNNLSRELIGAGSLLRADSLSKAALSLSEKNKF